MRSWRRFIVLVPAIAVYLIFAGGLRADTFQFSFTNALGGGSPLASGTFTAIPQSNGTFLITSISGTDAFGSFSGAPMSLLASGTFGSNDNLLFSSAPFLDSLGFSFSAGGKSFNIEFNTPANDPIDPIGYIQEGGSFVIPLSFLVSRTPEPSTLILIGSGIFALAAASRRKRLT